MAAVVLRRAGTLHLFWSLLRMVSGLAPWLSWVTDWRRARGLRGSAKGQPQVSDFTMTLKTGAWETPLSWLMPKVLETKGVPWLEADQGCLDTDGLWISCYKLRLDNHDISILHMCIYDFYVPLFFLLETGSHAIQADLTFAVYPRINFNFWFSCLHLWSTGITGMCHHARVYDGLDFVLDKHSTYWAVHVLNLPEKPQGFDVLKIFT